MSPVHLGEQKPNKQRRVADTALCWSFAECVTSPRGSAEPNRL
jgi:hypothetical protein